MTCGAKNVVDIYARIFYYAFALMIAKEDEMSTISRWAPVRSLSTLQEQMNRLFDTTFPGQADHSALASWAPAVDIYETENELVLKADLPEVTEKDLDIR